MISEYAKVGEPIKFYTGEVYMRMDGPYIVRSVSDDLDDWADAGLRHFVVAARQLKSGKQSKRDTIFLVSPEGSVQPL